MSNRDTDAAWRYHEATKHTPQRLRASRHVLDWDNQPLPFKIYPQLAPIALPALSLPSRADAAGGSALDAALLAHLLHFCAGITKKKVYPGGQSVYFRAAACTGALYHIDVYAVCAELPGLPAGVYHFGPHDGALRRLRAGDHRGVLAAATGGEPSIRHASVVLACVSTYWRNSWKYQARAYRHCFWDTGTLLANLFAVAAAVNVPARLIAGFVDETVSALLDLDPQREGPLALVALGREAQAVPAVPAAPPRLGLVTARLSAHEIDYPAIREMQETSALRTPDEVAVWRGGASGGEQGAVVDGTAPASHEHIESVIARRGSTRRFALEPISGAQLTALLTAATHDVPADYGGAFADLYLIVNAVDGLEAGTYAYRRDRRVLEPLRTGSFRREAGFFGLGQELPAAAAVNVYFLCDLRPLLERFGNRGYRVAQLDAAIGGGRVYLAAYALGLGATGLTFFDDEVTAFFSPDAAGKSVMFLVAAGHSAGRGGGH